jgi:hypothetical protein
MKLTATGITALLLAMPACASTAPRARAVETISYETGPCFGACPVYLLTVGPDGSGTFEGRRFTGVTGRRTFRITPARFRAFAARLEPLRPASGSVRYSGSPLCRSMATDLPSVDVKWRSRRGEQHLYFNYGCDMQERQAMAERLRNATQLLPISAFIRGGH